MSNTSDAQLLSGAKDPKYQRADYAPIKTKELGAWISRVDAGSPAERAGLEPDLCITSVNGVRLDDIITWRWEASDEVCELELVDREGIEYECTLEREPGEPWGIEFSDVLFDGIRTCRNACVFCFMSMLPPNVRETLHLRDDDYRLSFLQGNFVTLTNLRDEDIDRVINWRLEPMNVSLQAVSHEARRRLLGKNEARGLEVLERFSDAGIEVHAQIVLCPGYNDGEELKASLDYIEAHPNITSLAVVPLGYTKYSRTFKESYSDHPDQAREVIKILEPYQARSRERLGRTLFQLSDEFYLAAQVEVPPAEAYDGYPQFYDGIGMLRSFIDDTNELAQDSGAMHKLHQALLGPAEKNFKRVLLVCGHAAQGVLEHLVDSWGMAELCEVKAITNNYYGGNVNVTGLVVGCDLVEQLDQDLSATHVLLPEVMFNFAKVTLDDWSYDKLAATIATRGGSCGMCETSPRALYDYLLELAPTLNERT